MATDSYPRRLGEMPVPRLLLSMSLQTTFATFLYSLYSLVDTFFVARFVGGFAVGGMTVAFPLLMLLSGVSTTLGSGTASLVSRSLGRQNVKLASLAAANAMMLFYASASIITIIGLVFLDPLLYAMGVTDNLLPYARDYLQVMLFGAVTSTAFSSIIRAEGNTRFAMLLWIIPIMINTILDPILIIGFHAGVRGAAYATLAAQTVSVGMGVYYFFFSGKSALQLTRKSFSPKAAVIRKIVPVGLPSLIQMSSAGLSVVLANNILRTLGDSLAISGYALAFRLLAFFIIPTTGLSQAVGPIVGYNAGTGQQMRIRKTVTLAILVSAAYGILVTVVVQIYPAFWISIFTADPELIDMGAAFLKAVTLSFPISGISSLAIVHFQAVGKAFTAMILAIAQNILIFAPTLMIASALGGFQGILLAFPISMLIGATFSLLMMARHHSGPFAVNRIGNSPG